jgi:cytosine/adenosine deaminase-related metal-dependent hydrolase
MSLLLRGGTALTANPRGDVLRGADILITGDRISAISATPLKELPDVPVIEAEGCTILPGFVQTHVHLCQTLFRGRAEDFELLDWLRLRIFPFEAAHSARSMFASAAVGALELIRSGTTTILDMGSIHHQEEVIRAVGESGLRAFVGKALMDINDAYPPLREPTREALDSTRALAERWHGSYDGRIRYAVAPRFILSCSDALMREVAELLEAFPEMLLHTHACENRKEIAAVRSRFGMDNIEAIEAFRLLSGRSCLAHCVHVSDREVDLLAASGASIAHCPSSNLKLGSGIADVPRFLGRNIRVGLGADGAPCNNTLDLFHEMRLAAAMQKPAHGPAAMPARTVFELATIGGARALGLDGEIGSLEAGKKADLVILDLRKPWNPLMSDDDPFTSLVYSATPENVDSVMIDGRWVYRRREFVGMDPERTLRDARTELRALLERMG